VNDAVNEKQAGPPPALGREAPQETAARHIITRVPLADSEETVGTVLAAVTAPLIN
jgi:hypothetical protein